MTSLALPLLLSCVEYTLPKDESGVLGHSGETDVIIDTADEARACHVDTTDKGWQSPDMCNGEDERGEGNKNVQLEWSWTGAVSNPAVNDVVVTPVASAVWNMNADDIIDRNDMPAIFFVASDNGASATLVATTWDGRAFWELNSIEGVSPDPTSNPVIGDTDKDGDKEFLAVLNDGRIADLDPNGAVRWISTATVPGGTALGLFDLGSEEIPEVVAGAYLVSSTGGLIGRATTNACATDSTFAADVDFDGLGEWVASGSLWTTEGALDRTFSTTPFCFPVPFLESGRMSADLIGTDGANGIRRVALDGSVPWSYTAGGTVGPPAVGDIDDDTSPEVCFTAGGDTFVWDPIDGVSRVIDGQDDGSTTGCALVDLDGDGGAEVVRAGGGRAAIMNVKDGEMWLEETTHTNSRGISTPMAADLDSDGSVEVVFPADDMGGTGRAGLYGYGNPEKTWLASARRIWTQHAYDANQVDDDGRIRPASGSFPGDRFRCQYPQPTPKGVALQVNVVDACASTCEPVGLGYLSVSVTNRGGVEADGVYVDVYDNVSAQVVERMEFGDMNWGDITATSVLEVQWLVHPEGLTLQAGYTGIACRDLGTVSVAVPCP